MRKFLIEAQNEIVRIIDKAMYDKYLCSFQLLDVGTWGRGYVREVSKFLSTDTLKNNESDQHVVSTLPVFFWNIASMLLSCCQHVASRLQAGCKHVASRLQVYRVAHMFWPSLKSSCGLTGQTNSQFQILSQF